MVSGMPSTRKNGERMHRSLMIFMQQFSILCTRIELGIENGFFATFESASIMLPCILVQAQFGMVPAHIIWGALPEIPTLLAWKFGICRWASLSRASLRFALGQFFSGRVPWYLMVFPYYLREFARILHMPLVISSCTRPAHVIIRFSLQRVWFQS